MHQPTRRAFISTSVTLAGLGFAAPLALADPPGSLADRDSFFSAVAAGDLARVGSMLDRDPGLLARRDATGRSAFAVALLARRAEVAELLSTRGHRPDLHEAALALDWERFDELAEPDPLRVNDSHAIGGTAMTAAAIGGAGSSMWRVYRYCGDPQGGERDASTPSPVRAALDFPDLPTAELTAAALLANGADPNRPEPGGRSALHVAAARGSLELIEMLVRLGAAVEARDAAGHTPLELAESAGHERAAAMLRTHAAIPRTHSTSRRARDVNGAPCRAPNFTGLSPIERGHVVGSAHRDIDGVRAALQRDARLAHSVATTTEGAVEAGAHMGNVPIVDLLLEHGAPCSLPTAVMRGDVPRVRALLAEDPLRIHERGAHDFALLWYPIIGRTPADLAELLLEAGADVEQHHHLGTTALHWAAMSGRRDLAELLLDRGANIDRVGRKFGAPGETPLQLAVARSRDEMVTFLRQRGARG